VFSRVFESLRPQARTLSALVLFTFAFCAGAAVSELHSGVFEPPRAAPDFSLKGSDGTDLRLSRYRGKVIALAFGYTHCPGVCPATLGYLAQVRKKLGAAAGEFQVLYVTVDPERDDVATMKAFLSSFDPTFVGGTGTARQLADVRKAYGISVSDKIYVETMPKSSYFLDHSAFIYLIDRQGTLRAMAPFGESSEDIEHDVKALLAR